MKGLIIASGEIKNYDFLRKLVEEHDYIVCADGGANHLLKIGEFPDIVLGDLDSIGKKELNILKKENIEIYKFPTMKDETDTEICVNHLLEKNIKNISLIGVTGTRIDHTLANICLLKKLYNLGAKATIVDDKNRILYLETDICLKRKDDWYISIVPISEDGISVSLSGFLYPLKKEVLEFGSTQGISNKIIKEYGQIMVHSGSALIIEAID